MLVGLHFATKYVGNDFFMSRAETEIAVVTILHAQHFIAHFLPTARFLPQLRGLDNRHQQLLRTAAIEFFANDGFDITQHPQA